MSSNGRRWREPPSSARDCWLPTSPISHQNREWAETMMDVLGLLAAQGTACVLATHDEIAFAAANRVLDLQRGRLRPRGAEAG